MSHIKIAQDIIDKDILDEKILLDLTSGEYHSLSSSGAFIWDQIKQRKFPDDILKSLILKYEIDADEAKHDLNNFLSKLKSIGFIEK